MDRCGFCHELLPSPEVGCATCPTAPGGPAPRAAVAARRPWSSARPRRRRWRVRWARVGAVGALLALAGVAAAARPAPPAPLPRLEPGLSCFHPSWRERLSGSVALGGAGFVLSLPLTPGSGVELERLRADALSVRDLRGRPLLCVRVPPGEPLWLEDDEVRRALPLEPGQRAQLRLFESGRLLLNTEEEPEQARARRAPRAP